MRRNYVCELVRCRNWNSMENSNEDVVVEEINIKCQYCKHCRLSVLKSECNYEERD